MFNRILASIAVLLLAFGVGIVFDLSRNVKNKMEGIPQIVENSKKTTDMAAEFAEDAKDLRGLLGINPELRDKSVLRYARGLMDTIEKEGKGAVLITEIAPATTLKGKAFNAAAGKLLGAENSTTETPMEKWIPRARKDALTFVLLYGTKEDVLHELCVHRIGGPFGFAAGSRSIKFPNKPAVPLEQWIRTNHAPSNEIGAPISDE